MLHVTFYNYVKAKYPISKINQLINLGCNFSIKYYILYITYILLLVFG